MRRTLVIEVVLASAMLLAPVSDSITLAQSPSAGQPSGSETDKGNAGANLKPGANSFVESQARALLQAKGYTNISPLMNDKTGIWHGSATKDDRQIEVGVDYQGHIAER